MYAIACLHEMSRTIRFHSFLSSVPVFRITVDFMYIKLQHYRSSLVINYLTEIKYVTCSFIRNFSNKKSVRVKNIAQLKELDLIKSKEELT